MSATVEIVPPKDARGILIEQGADALRAAAIDAEPWEPEKTTLSQNDNIVSEPKPEVDEKPIFTIDGLPAVELPCAGRTLGEFAAEVGTLLAGAGVYCRGGLAFRVNRAGKKLEAIDGQFFRTWAEREIRLFKTHVSKGDKQIALKQSMTSDTANALIVSPQFLEALPVLEKFQPVRMPVMRADGSVELLPKGFDAPSLTLTDETGTDYANDMPPAEGVAFLGELLAEFPFADDRSKAVAVAAMLTVYAGGLLPKGATVPAFLFQGNAEGSGKTTLAKLAGAPYGAIECKPAPTTEAEWQKRLLSLCMSGRRLVLLDNLKGHLNSPSLENYLTAGRYGDRILGVSKEFEGDADAVILLTGNGLTVTPDMRRRVLVCELFMRELRAEDRTFKRRLDEPAMLEMQARTLAALWAVIRHWHAKGKPPASRMNSSFPRWCEVIGGIVEAAGFGCPTTPAILETGGDTDTRDIARLGEAMELGTQYTFAELVALCEARGLFERFTEDTEPLHRKAKADVELIPEDSAPLTRKAKSGFGKTLGNYSGRTVAEGRVFHADGKGHAKRYLVREPAW
jgi:hypothetical protein